MDPLSGLVQLLRPRAVFSKPITGKGDWAVHYARYGHPSFCIVLAGSCLLAVDGQAPITIAAGDFVLLPATPAFTISSSAAAATVNRDPYEVAGARGELRYGELGGEPDLRSLGGAFLFDCADPALLVGLLPAVVHVRGSSRLQCLVGLASEESAQGQPGSEVMLSRLADMLLVEAMRSVAGADAPAGLLKGLGDERLAVALRLMHAQVERAWTVDALAKAAALSRSSFFERFTRIVGVAPMEYLLFWRMEIAKDLLLRGELKVAQIAERVGYGSSSAFSTAFSRQIGSSPRQFMLGSG